MTTGMYVLAKAIALAVLRCVRSLKTSVKLGIVGTLLDSLCNANYAKKFRLGNGISGQILFFEIYEFQAIHFSTWRWLKKSWTRRDKEVRVKETWSTEMGYNDIITVITANNNLCCFRLCDKWHAVTDYQQYREGCNSDEGTDGKYVKVGWGFILCKVEIDTGSTAICLDKSLRIFIQMNDIHGKIIRYNANRVTA